MPSKTGTLPPQHEAPTSQLAAGSGRLSGGKRRPSVRLSDEIFHPTPAFRFAALHTATADPGVRFGRIFFDRHMGPLGFGKTPSHFGDPRRRIPSHRFGVLYLGEALKVCFLEAVLRDSRNGAAADYPMDERELHLRRTGVWRAR